MPQKQTERTQVWSCGGGTQSAAIAALIVQGRLPKPDIALMIDTEREKSSTWEYLEAVLRPNLLVVGVEITVVKKSLFTTCDLYSGDKVQPVKLLLPMYTTQAGNAKPSKLHTYCSNEWKQRVAMRYLRSIGVKQCTNWLGMSVDEASRLKDSPHRWIEYAYPLAHTIPTTRAECVQIVHEIGWPPAPRSACKMCPNMRYDEWYDMYWNHPSDFVEAVEIEKQVRVVDPHVFLYMTGVPLSEVDFSQPPTSKADHSHDCNSGMCFV